MSLKPLYAINLVYEVWGYSRVIIISAEDTCYQWMKNVRIYYLINVCCRTFKLKIELIVSVRRMKCVCCVCVQWTVWRRRSWLLLDTNSMWMRRWDECVNFLLHYWNQCLRSNSSLFCCCLLFFVKFFFFFFPFCNELVNNYYCYWWVFMFSFLLLFVDFLLG